MRNETEAEETSGRAEPPIIPQPNNQTSEKARTKGTIVDNQEHVRFLKPEHPNIRRRARIHDLITHTCVVLNSGCASDPYDSPCVRVDECEILSFVRCQPAVSQPSKSSGAENHEAFWD